MFARIYRHVCACVYCVIRIAMKLIAALTLLHLLVFQQAHSAAPGLRIAITEKGLDYSEP